MQRPNERVPGLSRICPGGWKDSVLQRPSFRLPWSHVLDKSEGQIAFWSLESIFAVTQSYFLFVLIDLQWGPGPQGSTEPWTPPNLLPARFLSARARSVWKQTFEWTWCRVTPRARWRSMSVTYKTAVSTGSFNKLEDISNNCCLVHSLKHSLHDVIPQQKPSSMLLLPLRPPGASPHP